MLKDIQLDGILICSSKMARVIFQNLTGENFPGGRSPFSDDDTHKLYIESMEDMFDVSFANGKLELVGENGVERTHQFGEIPFVPVETVET